MRSTRVLGISPGTRRLGITVIARHSVFYCRMKSFIRGSWSDKKLQAILSPIERLIVLHDIKHIALKIPPSSMHTLAVKQLIAAIEALAKSKHVKFHTFTLPKLKKAWQRDKKTRFYKRELKERILERYNVQHIYAKELKTKTNHYEKAFEAIGVADIVLRRIK